MRVGGILGAILIFIGITIAWGAWYTVSQNERGVLLRWGAMVDDNVEPGIHWKTPWIESYDTVSVATQSKVYGAGEDQMEAYSKDQQPAHFRISVIYHIPADKVGEVYWRYGGDYGIVERVLDRHVNQQSKNVFGRYTALATINERAKFNKDILDALAESLKNDPIVVEGVQVEDVQFSKDYIDAVKARMIAEVEVQKLRQQEEQQKVNANITVINADAAAKATVAKAEAEARSIQLQGEAQAAAIKAQAEALAQNPNLVLLRQAERWNGVLPTQMLPGSAVPFLNLTPIQGQGPISPVEGR